MRFCSEEGQSTVEAAVLLPALFALFGIFLQPGILLYDHCVMNAAAAEGCRLVATQTMDDASIRAYMERRLGGIPKIGIFHEGDAWDLDWSGKDSKPGTSMTVVNHVRPLPLFGIMLGLAGMIDAHGLIEQRVEVSCSSVPAWTESSGTGPSEWIGAWK